MRDFAPNGGCIAERWTFEAGGGAIEKFEKEFEERGWDDDDGDDIEEECIENVDCDEFIVCCCAGIEGQALLFDGCIGANEFKPLAMVRCMLPCAPVSGVGLSEAKLFRLWSGVIVREG